MTQRSVIADEHVLCAFRRGRKHIEVMPGDIVTAHARDTAKRLQIKLLEGPLEKPAVVRTDGATAMRRVLYRRHPGWRAPVKRPDEHAIRLSKLALVGAGGVGSNVAHLAANQSVADEIVITDVLPGAAQALALDLQHAGGITRSSTRISGNDAMHGLVDANVVVVSAGRPRTPGMSRAELLTVNGRVIRRIGQTIGELAPNAVVIVVSNPLDEMTHSMLLSTGFSRNQVLGMAGTLDSARFRDALARAADVDIADVQAMTLGSHGDEMVPVTSRATIRDRPLSVFLNPSQIEQCRADSIEAGANVVRLRKTGSATLAPAHATLELIDYIRGARVGAVPASVLLQGEYGIDGTVIGVPCRLGVSGLICVDELPLQADELIALQDAANAVAARIKAS